MAWHSDDSGKLVLRVTIGGLMLMHGVAKLRYGIDFIQDAVTQAGLPPAVAYGVYLGEIVAPVMLILGMYTRTAALLVAIDMIGAIWLARMGDIGSLNQGGGWAIELEVLYLLGAIAIALVGSGRYAVGWSLGRKPREVASADWEPRRRTVAEVSNTPIIHRP
ncbi:MAG TPA: DoxX family protein [Gemmatimonadaceae bacterium]